jgi:hypothetical protein
MIRSFIICIPRYMWERSLTAFPFLAQILGNMTTINEYVLCSHKALNKYFPLILFIVNEKLYLAPS